MASPKMLYVWVPSNRRGRDGAPRAMDGLNEIIADNRANKYNGARIERENVEWVTWYVMQAMNRQHWQPMLDKDKAVPCKVLVTFVETSDRRDVANVFGGGLKYTLDALTRAQGRKGGAGAIYDDSVRWLSEVVPSIRIDPMNPGIEITVIRSA